MVAVDSASCAQENATAQSVRASNTTIFPLRDPGVDEVDELVRYTRTAS